MPGFNRTLRACAAALPLLCGCHSLLDVPVPRNVVDPGSLTGKSGGESLRNGAVDLLAHVADNGFYHFTGMLTDEYRDAGGYSFHQTVDSRNLPENEPPGAAFDVVFTLLQDTRIQANLAVAALLAAPGVPETDLAEAYSVEAYSYLLLAEAFCSGVPISYVAQSGAVTGGDPVTRDSLLGTAVALFDSAAAHAGTGDSMTYLAQVGQARALLDRGQYAAAGALAAAVPLAFKYSTALGSTAASGDYAVEASEASTVEDLVTVGDSEGTNGLNFVSAQDPRVPTDTIGTTQNGIPAVFPSNFRSTGANPNPALVLASGIEAQLDVAEAALNAGDATTWLTTLNNLRTGAIVPAMGVIADPVVPGSRVDTMFTERAFWLYGTGHRMGDLRRLVRWYGRDQSTVFPTGPYINGTGLGLYPTYGTDVNAPMPSTENVNPKFTGCIDRNA
jgi:hypothetical protein